MFVRGGVNLFEGLVLLIVFVLYILFVSRQKINLRLEEGIHTIHKVKTIAWFTLGVILLLGSAHFVVSSAVEIATYLNVPQSIIALTMIAFGTTLAELTVDINAIRKGHATLALGDILGSCTVNLTLVLGVGSIINPITINLAIMASAMLFLIGVNIFLTYTLFKYKRISKKLGLLFLIAYIAFILFETEFFAFF